ncbi:hypothetical protein V1515DRAFT_603480, partial [Lipomyces mesembrius]
MTRYNSLFTRQELKPFAMITTSEFYHIKDNVIMEQFRVEESNVNVLAIGRRFGTDCKARSYVQQYAISNNLAVKNGWVKYKENTFLLIWKCSGKVRNTRNLPAVVGTRGDNGMTRHQEARSILSHCPWRVRFKKQL